MEPGRLVEFPVNDHRASGYWAAPPGDGPWPGVVVIQEWWGLDDHIKSLADRFAAAGYAALAPDLYDGQVATEPDEARKLAMSLREQWAAALAVIQGSVDFLNNQPGVSPKSIGVTGFCMGGGLAWHAARMKDVGAVVPFYGGGPELTAAEAAASQAPILAIYGELDQGVSPQLGRQRAERMAAAGASHEMIVYPGAQHAFFNDTRPVYDPQASADAWSRMLSFFIHHLK